MDTENKKDIYERLFVLLFRQMDRDKIDITKFVENYLKVHKECELINNSKKESDFVEGYYKSLDYVNKIYFENFNHLVVLIQADDLNVTEIIDRANTEA